MDHLSPGSIVRIVLVLIIIGIALLIRVSVLVSDVPLLGDSKTRYDPIANNLLAGRGFSRDTSPPYRADSFDQPGYPLLLASIYKSTDGSKRAVVLFQLFLELLVLLTVVGIARELKLQRGAQILAVVIGLICPFLAKYAGLVLTEVLATLTISVACYAFLRAVNESTTNKSIWWALAGGTSGLSLLIRADTLIVVALISGMAMVLARPLSRQGRLKQTSFLIISLVMTLAPWTFRNYLRFKAFKPLGSVANQARRPYVKWMDTWFDDPAELKTFWWDSMKEDENALSFPAVKIPDDEERNRAMQALLLAREQKTMTGEPARQFQDLATEAIRKRPLQAFVIIPLKRTIKTWAYPQINKVPTLMRTRLPFFMVHGLWFMLWGFALLGLLHALRLKRYTALLLVAVIVGRMLLPFISSLGSEPRFLIETLPALYVLSALGMYAVAKFVGSRSSVIRQPE